jgi:hypothetical protein
MLMVPGPSSLAGHRQRMLTTGLTAAARRPAVRAAAARPSGRGRSSAGDADADASAPARKRSSSSSPTRSGAGKNKPNTTTTTSSEAEAAAREVLYTSADLAAEAVGAAAGAAEAAAEAAADAVGAAADAAEDAVTAATGLASSVAREAEEAASDFVFATASMADAAAAALQEAVVGASLSSSSSSSSSSSAKATGAAPPAPAPPVLSATELKRQLVQAVAGLDRGLGASLREARAVDALARRLERAAPVVVEPDADADATTSPSSAAADASAPLAPGCWRLIYSSAFGGGSLGGSRPGPPAALTPLVLGGVFQVVDRERGTLDNVVELLAPGLAAPKALVVAPLKALSSALGGAFGNDAFDVNGDDDDDDDPTPGVRLTLRHDYEILSSSSSDRGSGGNGGATVRIVFEDTYARALGPSFLASRLPQLAIPSLPEPLRPPRGLRAATFEVTYEDGEMRVTRGDRGELRVFLRELGRGLDAAPIRGWVEPPRRAAAAAGFSLSSMED